MSETNRTQTGDYSTGGMVNLSTSAASLLYGYGRAIEKAESVKIVEIDGVKYYESDGQLKFIPRYSPPIVPATHIYTLEGFVQYLNTDPNAEVNQYGKMNVIVRDYKSISAYAPTNYKTLERELLAICENQLPPFPFDRYMEPDEFVILMLSRFEQTQRLEEIMALCSNISTEESEKIADDGYSQRVTIDKSMKVGTETAVIKNPVALRPVRTFPEVPAVDQPFVLRFKDGKVALFEVPGSGWQEKLVKSIGKYIDDNLSKSTKDKVTVIA